MSKYQHCLIYRAFALDEVRAFSGNSTEIFNSLRLVVLSFEPKAAIDV